MNAAQRYAADQELEARRQAIREENKDRKKNGLPALPLPRSSKSVKKRLVVLEEDPERSGSERETRRTRRKRSPSPAEEEDTLEYEGREWLELT